MSHQLIRNMPDKQSTLKDILFGVADIPVAKIPQSRSHITLSHTDPRPSTSNLQPATSRSSFFQTTIIRTNILSGSRNSFLQHLSPPLVHDTRTPLTVRIKPCLCRDQSGLGNFSFPNITTYNPHLIICHSART